MHTMTVPMKFMHIEKEQENERKRKRKKCIYHDSADEILSLCFQVLRERVGMLG
jgi:hypothetical protein